MASQHLLAMAPSQDAILNSLLEGIRAYNARLPRLYVGTDSFDLDAEMPLLLNLPSAPLACQEPLAEFEAVNAHFSAQVHAFFKAVHTLEDTFSSLRLLFLRSHLLMYLLSQGMNQLQLEGVIYSSGNWQPSTPQCAVRGILGGSVDARLGKGPNPDQHGPERSSKVVLIIPRPMVPPDGIDDPSPLDGPHPITSMVSHHPMVS